MAGKKGNTTTKQPRILTDNAVRNVVEHADRLETLLHAIPRTSESASLLDRARELAVQIMLDVADPYGNIHLAGEAA